MEVGITGEYLPPPFAESIPEKEDGLILRQKGQDLDLKPDKELGLYIEFPGLNRLCEAIEL